MDVLMRTMRIEDILGMSSSIGTSQTEFLLSIRMSGIKEKLTILYRDVGNNAEYESYCTPYGDSDDYMTDIELEEIHLALDYNNDKIDKGNMFMIDFMKSIAEPITFIKVLEEQ